MHYILVISLLHIYVIIIYYIKTGAQPYRILLRDGLENGQFL